MNAYELAEKLEWHWDNDCRSPAVSKSADMLRQQADRIAELEKLIAKGDREGDFRSMTRQELIDYIEYLRQCIDAPQTKPLSDEEIYSLLDKCIEYTDDHDQAEFMYKKFARAIEERHGIK